MRPGGTDSAGGPVLIGCDVGTSSVKTIVVNGGGALLGRAAAEHPMRHPRPGWNENDPRDWYDGLAGTVRAAVAGSAVRPDQLAGLCVVCQREPVVLTGAGGQPLAPSISWTDTRAVAEAARVTAKIGADRLADITGMTPTHGMSLAHLLWLRRHRADLWRSVTRVQFAKDYLLGRLTGCRRTDPTTPSRSGMLDARRLSWSGEILDAFGIDPGLLPEIGDGPWRPVPGGLSPAAAADLGLRPGLPVAMGGSDDASAALGCGAIDPGQACVGTGTAANWRTVLAGFQPDRTGAGDVSPHVVPDRYLHEVAIESTGSSLRWLRDLLAAPGTSRDGFDQLIAAAAAVEPGAGGLRCFPFADGAARAPRYAAGARAAFLGAASGHSGAHLARAMLEGIAFQYRATLPILTSGGAPGGPLSLRGPLGTGDGEARNPVFTQLKADVLGVPLRVPRIADLAAAGAAILAGVAAGVYPDVAAGVAALVHWDRRYDPDPGRSAVYARLAAEYEWTYQRLAGTFGSAPSGMTGNLSSHEHEVQR